MVAEWKNLLVRCGNPAFAAKAGVFYLTKVAATAVKRALPPAAHYPRQVRQASKMLTAGIAGEGAFPCGDVTAAPPTRLGAGQDRLKLATGYYWFTGRPQWETVFEDPEQTVSLHRWNWLLVKLTEEPSPAIQHWGLDLMRDWTGQIMKANRGLPWESYTTGERICNAILFLAITDRSLDSTPKVPGDIAQALAVMARYLACRLEYKGGESTGNHVINNARALCFAGQALQIAPATELAAAILRNDLSRLVPADGFLREGSSHYHFLVTRWLLEILWICRVTGEQQVRALVEPTAALMVERCWFFLVRNKHTGTWVMPTIGDVSPDCSWQWLIDLPWCREAMKLFAPEQIPPCSMLSGWASLFDGLPLRGATSTTAVGMEQPVFRSFPESGWYRLDWGALTVFWHVEPCGAPPFISHGHCDIGAFCLYWDGTEILTDPGRLNYQEHDSLGLYGLSARAHNSVLIDGLEPFIYRYRGRYPDSYRQGNVDVSWGMEGETFRMAIRHTGFSRLDGDRIVFTRVFRVGRGQFVIEDSLEGRARHLIETYFQWAPCVSLRGQDESGHLRIAAPAFRSTFHAEPIGARAASAVIRWRLVRGADSSTPGGWYFPAYGEKMETSTLVYECETLLPCAWRYLLQWQDSDPGSAKELADG